MEHKELSADKHKRMSSKKIKISKQPKEVCKNTISKRDLKVMLVVQGWFLAAKRQNEEHKRALDIRTVEAESLNSKSLIFKILDLYKDSNEPQHIVSIINNLEAGGYNFKSIYHKYNSVRNTIREYYYFFIKTGKGQYKLRQGLAHEDTVIEPLNKTIRIKTNIIPTIKSVVIDVAKNYLPPDEIYPGRLFNVLNLMGFRCAYSTVRRAMQSKNDFARNGFIYKVL